jgi:hypothetical protein
MSGLDGRMLGEFKILTKIGQGAWAPCTLPSNPG